MKFLNKLFTAARGAVNEAGEAAVDANAIRILEQELRDADKANGKAKDELAAIMGKKKLAERKVEGLEADLEKRLGQVRAALDKGDEGMAREVAEVAADLKRQVDQELAVVEQYDATCEDLRSAIRQNDRKMETLSREVDTVKANEALVKAQSAVAAQHSGASSALGGAADSLRRIKEKQAAARARMEAAGELEQLDGADLDRRLADAGITSDGTSTDDILALARGDAQKQLPSS